MLAGYEALLAKISSCGPQKCLPQFANDKTCPGHVIFMCTSSPKSVMGTGGCKLVAKSNCAICYEAKFRQISSCGPQKCLPIIKPVQDT